MSDRRTSIFTLVASLVLVVLLGACGLLYWLAHSTSVKSKELASQNIALQQQINTQQADLGDAKAYQAQLANIGLLLKSHSYFTPAIKELNNFTFQKSQYLTLDIGQDSEKIHVEGRVDNYTDLGKLLLGFSTSPNFKNVKLLSVVPSQGARTAYIFSVDMDVLPDLFINKNR